MADITEKLCASEKKLYECVDQGHVDEVLALLRQPGVRVDSLDDHGMTPLQHAAYRGHKELCEVLLANGADVNSRHHDHGYTCLMFAALSGKTEVTQLMLEAGANVNHGNAVGRNAAQMAAFVGQHQCVSVINNFFSKEDLEYYCQPRGLEKEPKLPPELCSPLYHLIVSHNLSPIKMSMIISESPDLLREVYKVTKVLDLLVEKMMKQSGTNEIMAMKFHYLATLVRRCDKWIQEKGGLDSWIKCLVKGRSSDGCREFLENFIRSVFKSFPYMDSQLLQQMVRTLAPVAVGDSPSSLSVFESGINGQRFASEEDSLCTTCGQFKAKKKCSACKAAVYCNQLCQKLDWATHKKLCAYMAEAQIQQEKRKAEEERRENERKQAEKEQKSSVENTENNPSSEDNGQIDGTAKDDPELPNKETEGGVQEAVTAPES